MDAHSDGHVDQIAGGESPLRDADSKLRTADTLWSGYKRRLTAIWGFDAIEVIVKDAIQADVVLRADAVFVSPEKTFTQRVQRSAVIGVQPWIPILVISSGVGFNSFDFKTLQLVKATVTADDGTVSTKDRFVTVDDTSWARLTPVWIQSIRLWRGGKAGVYGTFGTTPDRNIFKNAIWGGSVIVPRWRTSITAGVISARGFTESELQPVISAFSSDGFALASVSATNVPLPKTSWHHSFYLSATFVLASF